MTFRSGAALLAALALGGVDGGAASAAVIDLTAPGASALIEEAIFQEGPGGAPAGNRIAFLRLQASGTEGGFNTDYRPLPPDAVSTLVTHAITKAILSPRIWTTSQGSYAVYTFLLDANEATLTSQNFISLDELRIYTATGFATPATLTELHGAGTIRYNMDASSDNTVLLNNNNNPGTGIIDLQIMIPTSALTDVADGDYVFLYARCGAHGLVSGNDYGTGGGFEEFLAYSAASAVEGGPTLVVPWIRFSGAPSAGKVRFRYYVPGSGPVRITLYDVQGRSVASFQRSSSGSGTHDGALERPSGRGPLPSGIYLYRFEWNGIRRTGKIALLK